MNRKEVNPNENWKRPWPAAKLVIDSLIQAYEKEYLISCPTYHKMMTIPCVEHFESYMLLFPSNILFLTLQKLSVI